MTNDTKTLRQELIEALSNAPKERRIVEQELRQRADGPIETLKERIEYVVTDESRADACLAVMARRLGVSVNQLGELQQSTSRFLPDGARAIVFTIPPATKEQDHG